MFVYIRHLSVTLVCIKHVQKLTWPMDFNVTELKILLGSTWNWHLRPHSSQRVKIQNFNKNLKIPEWVSLHCFLHKYYIWSIWNESWISVQEVKRNICRTFPLVSFTLDACNLWTVLQRLKKKNIAIYLKMLNGVLNTLTWIPLLSYIIKWNTFMEAQIAHICIDKLKYQQTNFRCTTFR